MIAHAIIAASCAAFAVTAGNPTAAAQSTPAPALNTMKDMFAALRACWIPPPLEKSRPGMQITVLMSFKRNGELLGPPRITFETAAASDADRLAYRIAVAATLTRCSPLPFSDALGNAVAGRPFTMRFIDQRNLRQAGLRSWPTTTTR